MTTASRVGWPASAQSAYEAVESTITSSFRGNTTAKSPSNDSKRDCYVRSASENMSSTPAQQEQELCNDVLTTPVVFRKSQSDVGSRYSVEENDVALRMSHSLDIRKAKKLDKYGFIVNMDLNGEVHENYDDHDDTVPTFAEQQVAQRRIKKWNSMMSSWELAKKRRRRLSKRLRKGVPDAVRGKVWAMLGNVQNKDHAGVYDKLVHQTTEKVERLPPSQALLLTKSFKATQETIERDIHRTYPRHSMFHEDSEEEDLLACLNDDEVSDMIAELEGTVSDEPHTNQLALAEGGQASLRRVLRAYSCYDREVGYCQGMNFIAGMFLTFMSEEEAFWVLVAVMNDPPCRMRGLFGEGMSETHQVLFIAENLLHQFLPKLAKHLDREHVHITMYATQWLLTLYTSSFKFDLVTRVWDIFLAEGWKIVYRVMLALMQYSQPVLMTLSFEEVLAYFRELPEQVEAYKIMDIALKIPLRKKHLLKFEKEYKARQASQQQEQQR